jgi:protein SCO1/2
MAEAPFGHEPAGISVRTVLVVAAAFAVMTVAVVVLLRVVVGRYVIPQHAQAVARRATVPPAPRLQASSAEAVATLRAEKQALLSTWRWTDTTHQFARIPIERAMELAAKQQSGMQQSPAGAATPSSALKSTPGMRTTGLRAPADLATRVGFDQELGGRVPMHVSFIDSDGAAVDLAGLLNDRPTLVVPGYYTCANLCGAVRAGVAHAIEGSGLTPGEQFNVVLVSIDSRETAEEAQAAKQKDASSHPHAYVPRWHYLTGSSSAHEALMRAIGFRAWFDERDGQYAHPAGIVLLSPGGLVTQYFFGVRFVPRSLRLALVGASRGRIGSFVDQLVLLCCDYNPSTGHYGLLVSRVLQALGVLTLLALGALIFLLRRHEGQRV